MEGCSDAEPYADRDDDDFEDDRVIGFRQNACVWQQNISSVKWNNLEHYKPHLKPHFLVLI